jgi:hypothetical protein
MAFPSGFRVLNIPRRLTLFIISETFPDASSCDMDGKRLLPDFEKE